MASTTQPLDFKALAEKAKKIEERRSILQAQEVTLSKQIKDLQDSLVQEYGANYIETFNESIIRIQEWDLAHAS